ITMASFKCAVLAIVPVSLVGCPGGVEFPQEIFNWIDDQLESTLKSYQDRGELPQERCDGEILGQGIYCPDKSEESVLAPFNQSSNPQGHLSGYVKGLGKAEGNFTATIATRTTYNRSVEHHHQPLTTKLTGRCDAKWVQWVAEVEQSTSLSMDGKIGGK